MVAIHVKEGPKAAQKFRDRHALTYPVLADRQGETYFQFRRGDVVDSFLPADTVATPYHAVLDRQGVVRYRGMGFNDAEIRRVIEGLL